MSIKSDAIIIKDETVANANTAARVGTNLVAIADDLISKQVSIDSNNGKVSYTEALVSANASVYANTIKNTYPSADATKLAGIEVGADVNTVNSSVTGEPTGSDVVLNIVSLTQAEYDAGTKIATTLYVIV
tara:strand:+ start:343 stop:735 length:393 start_codon:yes stop_codon:yes gene_type:complete